MTPLQEEALAAAEKINAELYKKWKDKDLDLMPQIAVVISNQYTFISLSIPSEFSLNLPEIHLFSSVNDDRIYYEKSDKYETLYKFIKRKFNIIKEELYSIKL